MNANPNPQAAAPETGLGPTLRALREARQIALSDVSGRVKFSVRQLQALEGEDWKSLPSGLALRGMVKNYGRFLETDVDALLVLLDAQTNAGGVPSAAHVVTPASLGAASLPSEAEHAGRPWGWLLIILVFLAVAGFYAIERGWIPDEWLVFDWLRALKP